MAEIKKIIGPANYWCKRCAHCESVELGCWNDVPIYICTDPYDGVEKRIAGNETVTCTMFNLANEVPVFKATKVMDKTNKYDNESCDKIPLLQHELEMDKLRMEIHHLEKEKVAHMKGIERLKKENEKLKNDNSELRERFADINYRLIRDVDTSKMTREEIPTAEERIEQLVKYEKELHKVKAEKEELINRYNELANDANDEVNKLKLNFKAQKYFKDESYKREEKLKNQIKNLQYLNEESFKREDELEAEINILNSDIERFKLQIKYQKCLKDEAYKREDELEKELNKVKSHDEAITKHFQNDEKLIDDIQKVIFPQEEGCDYTYSYEEILNKVKDFKVQSDENGTMYEEIEELRTKNLQYLNEIHERLAKHTDQCDEIAKLKNENISLNTINKGLADDLRAAKDKLNYLYFKAKEFTDMED